MLRFFFLLAVMGFLTSPFTARASYQMFCEIEGEVVSVPTVSEQIEFEFPVTATRDIEVEGLGVGEPDCHLIEGKTITVELDLRDAGSDAPISTGARLVLERYEMDVLLRTSGGVVPSIRHVRTGV